MIIYQILKVDKYTKRRQYAKHRQQAYLQPIIFNACKFFNCRYNILIKRTIFSLINSDLRKIHLMKRT